MRLKITLILLTCVYTLNAQVGIGTTTPQGELDIVTSADLGLVVPRVSDIDNVTDGSGGTPVNGTVVYDLSRESICYYTNNRWICLTSDASGTVTISDNTMPLSGASNYIKASNTDISDTFGGYVALSGDGLTLAVGAVGEDSNATGINGDESNNDAGNSGAVYVYVKSGGVWAQQAYIKASNAEAIDIFGRSLALDFTGDTLAVGASAEDSNATGIGGSQADNSADNTGAVYVFSRSGTTWTQQEYIKASNAETYDEFGTSLDLSDDGNTLVVGA
ncbi:MAG: FG-GAP repeat protein, partial [Altibacter sp.]|nr:FG-GAP repeat protein [Altibacter sp.]